MIRRRARTAARGAARRGTRRRAGFSLVELLVVVAVLGMIAGVTTIGWRSIAPQTSLNTDVRTLAARIASARSDAIARNDAYQVVYDLDNHIYWLRPPYGPDGQREADESKRAKLYETKLKPGVRFAEITIDGESYVDGLVKVAFDPLGKSSDHLILLYHEPYNNYKTVEVLALTGLIRMHDDLFRREEVDDADFN